MSASLPDAPVAASGPPRPLVRPSRLRRLWARLCGWRVLPFPDVTPEELESSLKDHAKWLKSRQRLGKPLCLAGRCLARLNLAGRDLSKADFSGADLSGANLRGARLRNARLAGTVLQDADLRDCDLAETAGLRTELLAGSDLNGTRLPETAKLFPLLEVAKDTAEKAQTLFFTLLAGCLFCWLTIAGTTDGSLVTNAGTAKLPFVGVEIPTAGFYLVAPAILLAVYIYLHLYLQRLWEALAGLPAVFPDGQRLDKQAFAWLLIGVIRPEMSRLRHLPTAFGTLGTWLPKFLARWLVPVTLGLFYLRNLPAHDWGATGLQIILFSTALVFSWRAARLMRRTFRDHSVKARSFVTKAGFGAFSLMLAVILAGALSGWTYLGYSSLEVTRKSRSYSGKEGSVYGYHESAPVLGEDPWKDWSRFAVATLSFGGRNWLRIEGDESRLSKAPETWDGKSREDFRQVQGPKLIWRDLSGAQFSGAFLPKADFRGSIINGVNFREADLRMIRVGSYYQEKHGWGLTLDSDGLSLGWENRQAYRTASVGHCDFSHADLRYAVFTEVCLAGTEFLKADLREATLAIWGGLEQWAPDSMIGADLRGATLVGNWSRTTFYAARLEGADLTDATLSTNTMAFVTFDKKTRFPEGFPEPVRTDILVSDFGALTLAGSFDGREITNKFKVAANFFKDAREQKIFRQDTPPEATGDSLSLH